jgi:hypothetical protein
MAPADVATVEAELAANGRAQLLGVVA